jgi:cysteine-rich repeat protein
VCTGTSPGPGVCQPIPGASCAAPVDLDTAGTQSGSTRTYSGSTGAGGLTTGGSCGGVGLDVFHTYTLPERGDVTFSTRDAGTTIDTVLHVRTTCTDGATELGCNNDSAPGVQSELSVLDQPAGRALSVIVDTANFNVGSYVLKTTLRPVRDAGQACDPTGAVTRCATGLLCRAADSTCVVAHAPTLVAVQALRLSTDRVRLVVDGSDVDGDASGISYRRRNSAGVLLDGADVSRGFAPAVTGQTAPFVGVVEVAGLAGLDVASFDVRVRDAVSLASDVQGAVVVPLPVRSQGEACDLLGRRDACVAGMACTDGGGVATCQPVPGYACADPVDLNALAIRFGDTWTYDGDNRHNAFGDAGSCGGAGLEVYHHFTLPERADVTLRTVALATTFATALVVRDQCVGTEIACNDGGPPGTHSQVSLADRPAATPLVIVVDDDTLFTGQGPYRLEVSLVPVREAGGTCDVAGVTSRCVPGLTCNRGLCQTPFTCGNGQLDAGEQCDDGAANSDTAPDACRTHCARAHCGDGVTDGGEQCDDQDTSNTDACTNTCLDARCGDGFTQPGRGESCDDGAANSDTAANACRMSCTSPRCGDAVVDTGERCDGGPANSDETPNACRTDCNVPRCGDAVVDAGEQCDEGPANDDAAANTCRTDCAVAHCGDGIIDAGEQCDAGALNSDVLADRCRLDCRDPRCGDGVRDAGEGCDDGNGVDGDRCSNTCTDNPWCGDGAIDPGEQCDDGPANSDSVADACRADCRRAFCGDDVADTGEPCDDGAQNSNTAANACRLDCTLPRCGDDVADAGEQCDAGVANSDVAADACRSNCTAARCGDGVSDTAEQCDNGAANSDVAVDACRTDCAIAHCGDDVVDTGEQCDDGAANSDSAADACRTTCRVARCGDGAVDAGEQCDDGAANVDGTPDACRVGCTAPRCGDGVRDTGEGCDDGNVVDDDECTNACAPTRVYDGTCNAPYDVVVLGTVTGGTTRMTGRTDDVPITFSAGGSCGGGGVENVHVYRTPARADVTISTVDPTTTFDTVLYVRATCAGSELACNDNGGSANRSVLTLVDVAAATDLFIFVDGPGFSASHYGPYALVVTLRLILAGGESCDPAGVASRCGGGLDCLPDLTCGTPAAPVLSGLEALRLDATRIRLVVDGQDVDGDARGIEYTRRDSAGGLLDVSPVFAVFSPSVTGTTSPFVAAIVLDGPPGQDVASVEARVRDDRGLLSGSLTAGAVDIPVRANGEPCDLAGLRDECASGAECRDAGGGDGTCQVVGGQ